MITCIKINDKFFCAAKNAKQQHLCHESIIDTIDIDCRMMNRDLECSIGAQIPHKIAELVHEDDLPENLTEDQYKWWHDRSFIDIVRIGPRIPGTQPVVAADACVQCDYYKYELQLNFCGECGADLRTAELKRYIAKRIINGEPNYFIIRR